MEGQAQDTAAAQPQKFQRYRSVKRPPKKDVATSAPAAVDTSLVKKTPLGGKSGGGEPRKPPNATAPSEQRHYAGQGTAVKVPSDGDRERGARNEDKASSNHHRNRGVISNESSRNLHTRERQERGEHETSTRPIPIGDGRERTVREASTRIPPTQRQRPREEQPPPRKEKRIDISQPGFDAPISAVNASDRHVYVTYKKSTIALPVTPTTTALDLTEAAAAAMPLEKDLDPKTALLWEDYRLYQFQRPLRRYENVRDVLNSWDGDEQNKLTITASISGKVEECLDMRYVAAQQPSDSTYFLYHTHQNGRWAKRIVTIHTNGQVTINKEGAKEKDQQNICHLTDFDIYHTSSRYKKKINAPRAYCLGVKSQQKRAVFHLNDDNFVHFFSTKDERLATSFHQAMQRWRSWHFVHVMGKTQKSQKREATQASAKVIPVPQHPKSVSADSAIHGLGSYKPLISPSRFERSDHKKVNAADLTSRSPPKWEDLYGEQYHLDVLQPLGRSKAYPPISFPKKLTKDPETGAPTTGRQRRNSIRNTPLSKESEPFTANGLLGNVYQERVQAQQQLPPTNPPALSPPESSHQYPPHQSTSPTRAASIRTTRPSTHNKSPSRKGSPPHNLPTPLIDLTPKFFEPPQHVRRERRIIPDRLPSSGLVDIATTPEVAINVPSATAWKRPGTSNGEGAGTGQTGGRTNGHTSARRTSNSHLRHRQRNSAEYGQQVQAHPLQQQQQQQQQHHYHHAHHAPAVPVTSNSGQPLARRGTLKTVGGPLNRSPRKNGAGS